MTDTPVADPSTPRAQRIYLEVPFLQNDAAKSAGARFDHVTKKWWVSDPSSAAATRWATASSGQRPAPRRAPATKAPVGPAQVVERRTVPTAPVPAPPYWFFDVPADQHEQALAVGGRFNKSTGVFFTDDPNDAALSRWGGPQSGAISPDLAGEDRQFGSGLTFDLGVDDTRSPAFQPWVSPVDWQRLRRMAIYRAGRACEVCTAQESESPRMRVHVRGRWEYDDTAAVRRLRRLIVLCDTCLRVTEKGLAGDNGLDKKVEAHMQAVLGLDAETINDAWRQTWLLWQARKARTWRTDLTLLTSSGIAVADAPAPAVASSKLRAALRDQQPRAAAPVPVAAPASVPAPAPVAAPTPTPPATPPAQPTKRGLFGFGRR